MPARLHLPATPASQQARPDPLRQQPQTLRGVGKDTQTPLQRGSPARLALGSNASACHASVAAAPSSEVLERNEYRRGVGLCVVNKQGMVFAARRIDDQQATWQMPQGGIDPPENPILAGLRELHEETGMTSVRYVGAIDPWLHYDFPTKVRAQFSGQWVRYRGQTQKWLLLRFDGADAEVDLALHGAPEFSEWRWMRLEELPRSVVDFKRGVYEAVACHFCPRIERLLKAEHAERRA